MIGRSVFWIVIVFACVVLLMMLDETEGMASTPEEQVVTLTQQNSILAKQLSVERDRKLLWYNKYRVLRRRHVETVGLVRILRRAQRSSKPLVRRAMMWSRLQACEGSWRHLRPYQGGLQHAPGTWRAYKESWMPTNAGRAAPWMQVHTAEKVLRRQGWRAWPACSRKLGYR